MKKVIVISGAILAATAGVAVAGAWTGGRPWAVVFQGDYIRVSKVCDHGRAVYVAEGIEYVSGHGVDVVENAPECQFNGR